MTLTRSISRWSGLALLLLLAACTHREPIEFREVQNVAIVHDDGLYLKGDAIFFNPNEVRGKLKAIAVQIFVNEKLAGEIDDHPNTLVKAHAAFTVPVRIRLRMDQQDGLNSLLGLLTNKKLDVRFDGTIHVSYDLVRVKVPVHYSTEVHVGL